MKKLLLITAVVLVGCDAPQQAQTPKLPPKYQVVYSQTIDINGANRWLGEIRNTETHEEFLVIEGSESYPISMVKR
jgi:uncharacterized protein YcfL